ncbi:FAD-dependent oxidoreductase [Paenibacillus mesotrionivorans]|uniref:FAD-dependent oxidoreductase n=1 Tax=Paenibacillus mesotrionivorans TaxID=3160968 RepID=A0ACC7P9L7_9BACL
MKPNQLECIETDVLIAGGGTSGCLAALAAAEEGARVVLVESDSALGGVATRGGIHRYYYGSPGGLQELVDRRTEEIARVFGGKTKGFHPEAKRAALSALCAERGVQVFLNTVVNGVAMSGTTVSGVRAASPWGQLRITAKVTVDCTGNGSVVRMAGGTLRYGRELDGIYHNYSYIPRGLQNGVLGYDNLDAGWVDPYDPWDVTRAFFRGREWVAEACQQGSRYFGLSAMLGLREGGRIEGDTTIRLADYIEDTPSPEVITRSYSHLDNHGFDTGNESGFSQLWISVLGLFTKGLWCDIPYGSLLPRGLEGILVGGRALSVDRDVSMGVRMQKDMHKVGEAAGVAAAISIQSRVSPRELDRRALQRRLLERGVLEQTDLERKQGRNLRFTQGPLAHIDLEEIKAAPESILRDLVQALGTGEGWKAVWLLAHKAGPRASVIRALTRKLQEDIPIEERMMAAITLCLMGSHEAVPFLLELIRCKEKTKLSDHPKCVPFWVAGFVLLRLLKSRAALQQALKALEETESSVIHTFLLDYLSVLLPDMSQDEQNRTASVLFRYLQRTELGADYLMHGERPESLHWSLELRGAILLKRLGREAPVPDVWREAEADPRRYVGRAAEYLLNPALASRVHASQEINLGEYDAAVIGGSVAGVVCAAKLAGRGLRVVLVESSGSLLTEITRARRTQWSITAQASPDSTSGQLLQALLKAGAYRNGELEPVLVQLAADRYIQSSGTLVLFEALYQKAVPDPQEPGHTLIYLALKNGTGTLRVRHAVFHGSPIEAPKPSASCFTLSAVLVGMVDQQPFTCELPAVQGNVTVQLRQGFYPEEAIMELSWYGEGLSSEGAAMAFVVEAVKELRKLGRIPEEASLAYIADIPWQEPKVGNNRGAEHLFSLQSLLQTGEDMADRILGLPN